MAGVSFLQQFTFTLPALQQFCPKVPSPPGLRPSYSHCSIGFSSAGWRLLGYSSAALDAHLLFLIGAMLVLLLLSAVVDLEIDLQRVLILEETYDTRTFSYPAEVNCVFLTSEET